MALPTVLLLTLVLLSLPITTVITIMYNVCIFKTHNWLIEIEHDIFEIILCPRFVKKLRLTSSNVGTPIG